MGLGTQHSNCGICLTQSPEIDLQHGKENETLSLGIDACKSWWRKGTLVKNNSRAPDERDQLGFIGASEYRKKRQIQEQLARNGYELMVEYKLEKRIRRGMRVHSCNPGLGEEAGETRIQDHP